MPSVNDQKYKDCILAWSISAQQLGLDPEQVIICAAQFLGLSIAGRKLSFAGQLDTIDLANRIASTSAWLKNPCDSQIVATGAGR
jgi:hypothetical protein